jgi:endoglucanase
MAVTGIFGAVSVSAQGPSHREGEVEVRGKELFRDGRPWIPHGFYQIAFEVAPANLPRTDHPFWATAQENFRPEEYQEMRASGADTVRIQIAQSGADRESREFDAAFLQKALNAVRAARNAGLTVIVCVQGESHVPKVAALPLPGPGTKRVWERIAPAFKDDRGVLFEMLNEPQPATSRQNWMDWKAAMMVIVRKIRETGAQNVLIADGLESGQTLEGAPLLDDAQTAYASHPYADKHSGQEGQTREAWEKKFGLFAQRAPVIITEWHFGGFFCDADTPAATLRFLHYIEDRHIGVVVGTWDWPPAGFGNARWGFPDGKFSSFSGLSCHQAGYGLGRVIEEWYTTGRIPASPE